MDDKTSRKEFLKKVGLVTGAVIAGPAVAGIFSSLTSFFPPPGTLRNLSPAGGSRFKEALWWKTACAGVQCTLCPFNCFLPEGVRGRWTAAATCASITTAGS